MSGSPIAIRIDEQACVSCALCVDVCPTDVLGFDEAKGIPFVAKAGECFGCLACSEECPAEAIHHEGVRMAQNFYQNPDAVELAARIALPPAARIQSELDEVALARGLADLSVRLHSLGAVLKETLNAGLPAVGSLAGKTLAAQLPRYQPPNDLPQALRLARAQFAPAWEIEPSIEGEMLKVQVKGCFVREVCSREKCELGGELCLLFGHYMVGYLHALTGLRLRLVQAHRDWKGCCYEAKIYS